MSLNLGKTVVTFLSTHAEQKFTARQIAEWIFENFPSECQEKKKNSAALRNKSDTLLVQQIVAEIGAQRPTLQKNNPQVKTTEGKPKNYYWTTKTDADEVIAAEKIQIELKAVSGQKPDESTLYPVLSEYLWSSFRIYSKRIDERKSSNKFPSGGNKWLYPDVVAMEDLISNWHHEVKEFVKESAGKRTKLWSFEVKKLVNRANVRESFFQAVSNSSWSNFGYLVTEEIEGDETMQELRMLFSIHGIGLIKLDRENPAESQILIPAREKSDVDWATCDRVASENKDFLQFIKLVRQFHQTGDPRENDWDLPRSS